MKQSNDRRKPFQGKHRHKDLREFKNQEIKRSLVHRARLRKNYFKLLEKEAPPSSTENQYDDTPGDSLNVSKSELGDTEGVKPDDGSEEIEESSSDAKNIRRSGPLPSQIAAKKAEKRKPMNFAERARLARERKEQNRQDQLEKVREKRALIEESKMKREMKKNNLSQRTKKGQPVMGPRITDLLDKIRKNA